MQKIYYRPAGYRFCLTSYRLADVIQIGWLHTEWPTSYRLVDVTQIGRRHTDGLTSYRFANVIQICWRHTDRPTSYISADVIQICWRHIWWLHTYLLTPYRLADVIQIGARHVDWLTLCRTWCDMAWTVGQVLSPKELSREIIWRRYPRVLVMHAMRDFLDECPVSGSWAVHNVQDMKGPQQDANFRQGYLDTKPSKYVIFFQRALVRIIRYVSFWLTSYSYNETQKKKNPDCSQERPGQLSPKELSRPDLLSTDLSRPDLPRKDLLRLEVVKVYHLSYSI